MTSVWKHQHFRKVLQKEVEDNFSDRDSNEVIKSAYSDLEKLINSLIEEEQLNSNLKKEGQSNNAGTSITCDKYDNALNVFRLILQFAQQNCTQIDNPEKLKLTEKLIDCLIKPSRHIFLAGEWGMLERQQKDSVLNLMREIKEQIPLKKTDLQDLITFAENPWSAQPVKNLINGKTEKEEEVLGLLSSEGVDGVALRIEMLVESGMYAEALKAVSTVVHALLSEEMILQSYVSTSTPSIVDRLVDIFIILTTKLNKHLRLFKVLKLIGLDDVNKICIRRLSHYMSGATTLQPLPQEFAPKKAQKPKEDTKESTDEKKDDKNKTDEDKDDEEKSEEDTANKKDISEEDIEMKDDVGTMDDDDENPDDLEDRFNLLEKGRCEQLFTSENCLKSLEVMMQWSLASMAVQNISSNLQQYLISEWIDKCMKNKEKFMSDVEVLLECAKQTTFLYTLAHGVHKRLGKEVEIKCLKIFIKCLTQDINEYEAVKRSKVSRTAMEAKLSRAFWLLSDIVYDRTSLSRECVLTGFSIKPDEQALNRIKELAAVSGVDQTEADSDKEMDVDTNVEKLEKYQSGLHCRVTMAGEEGNKRFVKSYHQARKVKQNTEPLSKVMKKFNSKSAINDLPFEDFSADLEKKSFNVTATKLRTNKPREKRTRNLEGLISIRGELVTEAANYNPLDKPCKSLDATTLNLPATLTDDLLIVISAPRWHMLTWVMAWPDLLKACNNLLKNPKLREPTEDLKYLNIDYTQFNGWSSDEEVTIYTGIEKGYEDWIIDGPDDADDKVSEGEASDDEGEVKHKIDWENYDDVDLYVVPEDYLKSTETDSKDTKTEEDNKSRKRKHPSRNNSTDVKREGTSSPEPQSCKSSK